MLNTRRDDTQAWAAIMAMLNCMASSRSCHMPPPQASTASLRVALAPNMASTIAITVRIMQTTHESGIQRWVKSDNRSPRLPTALTTADEVPSATRHTLQTAKKCSRFVDHSAARS